ncbi:hypothetical protein AAHC03_021081 [Spirometra sp. Aus1]
MDDPSMMADQILSKATNHEARCKPLVTRPKPEPPVPKSEAGEKGSESVSNAAAKGTSKDVKANGVDAAGQEMDVDYLIHVFRHIVIPHFSATL